MEAKIAIVIVCYNRITSVKQLLNSIIVADYGEDCVDLIFSVDYGEKQALILEMINSFHWPFGAKLVRKYNVRLGLKEHIYRCGNYTVDYDAIVVLEDDLTVSKGFYRFARDALTFYGNDERIAGVSLYKHCINFSVIRPFIAANNGYDVFLMQFAQSWGQCWTKRMWYLFNEWLLSNKETREPTSNIPRYITQWDEKSWLKDNMEYIIDTNKYYVYPQVSLSTNHSNKGTHNRINSNDYQVPLLECAMNYRFASYEDCIKYDSFFERVDIVERIPFAQGKKVCLDLYGYKGSYGAADLLISTAALPYTIVTSLQLKYRPHEQNCMQPEIGEDIFVYDLHSKGNTWPRRNKSLIVRYDVKSMHWKNTLYHGVSGFWAAVGIKMTKVFRKCKV